MQAIFSYIKLANGGYRSYLCEVIFNLRGGGALLSLGNDSSALRDCKVWWILKESVNYNRDERQNKLLILTSAFQSAILRPWLDFDLPLNVHRLYGAIDGRLGHFLTRWLRTGSQSESLKILCHH